MNLPELRKGIRIYDLLKEAGMELNNWAHANDPSKNTFWAWIEGDIAVVTVWENNIIAPTLPTDCFYTRYVARGQKGKGKSVDEIYRTIIKKNLPVHVIIKHKDLKRRALDPITWNATYEPLTGELTLKRGKQVTYTDQKDPSDLLSFSEETPATSRSRKMRQLAMMRSDGKCEYCGKAGFMTPIGAIFAEVHHIVPISEQGSDDLSNLIVLCPDHHRQAHYGDNTVEMRRVFMETRQAKPDNW